jgi:hypothetical protein
MEKRKFLAMFSTRPIYKEGYQNEYCNYTGTNLVSVGIKSLIIMMHLEVREAVDAVYRRTVLLWVGERLCLSNVYS